MSATSRQPLSMVSACPRPGIFSISGSFDRTARSYCDNVIVYAAPVG